MIQTLIIPNYLPPTINALMRGKMRARMRLERECRDLIAAHAIEQGILTACCRRRVTLRLTLAGRRRLRDVDASWKAVLDALVAARLLVNDSPTWCYLGAVEQWRGERIETRITLEDLA